MKYAKVTIAVFLGFAAVAAFASTVSGSSRAMFISRVLYSNAALGPTDAVDTGTLNTSGMTSITVKMGNGNTTQTRSVVFNVKNEAGATLYSFQNTTACAANTTCYYTMGPGSTLIGGGLTGASFPIAIPTYLSITVAAPASGTGAGDFHVHGQ